MRLIDADALIDTLYDHEFASYIDKGEVSTVINDEPTVDSVPVIRCRDCKHWQYESCFVESEECDADSMILDRFAFDFCSRAERRKEE